jgi:hypothetical protein
VDPLQDQAGQRAPGRRYVFDAATGLISEIRAYYASPQDPSLDLLELGGYDYAARGYALEPPPGERSPTRPAGPPAGREAGEGLALLT